MGWARHLRRNAKALRETLPNGRQWARRTLEADVCLRRAHVRCVVPRMPSPWRSGAISCRRGSLRKQAQMPRTGESGITSAAEMALGGS